MGSDRQARRHPQRGRRARVAGRVDEGLAIAHVVAQGVDELGRAGSFSARCSGRRVRRRSRRARGLRHDATARARSLAILHRCRTCPVARSRLGAERENSPRTAPAVKGDGSTSAPPRPGAPGRVLRPNAPGGRGVQSSCRATRPSPARPTRTCGSPRRRRSAVRLRGRRLHSRRRCRTGKSVRVRHGPRHCDQGARTPRRHWAHRPEKARLRVLELGVRRPPASSCSADPRELEGVCRPIMPAVIARGAATTRGSGWRRVLLLTSGCLLSRGDDPSLHDRGEVHDRVHP
jgi:hypothetical protein